jgi:hypothetical protein
MLLNKIIDVFYLFTAHKVANGGYPFAFALSRTTKIIGASIIPLAFSIQDLVESRGSDSESRWFRVRFEVQVPLWLPSF